MVERAVNVVYTNVYYPIRSQYFTALSALNGAIQHQLVLINNKLYKNTAYSRWYYYEAHEKAVLKILPSEPYCHKKAVLHTVKRNYHVSSQKTIFLTVCLEHM